MAEGQAVAVVGGGPAGLMAADVLSAAGFRVIVFEAMPSIGRKLLMAGRGGLNLTHSEPIGSFLQRYGTARDWLGPLIGQFDADAARAFAEDLGQETFVGSSGRVFPRSMKASPLLRAWLGRLAGRGVAFRMRHRWTGFNEAGAPVFETPEGTVGEQPMAATVLALGGASWPRLGSDGGWVQTVTGWGVEVAPLTPHNAGVVVAWSEMFASRFAGTPVKRVRVAVEGGAWANGELVVTRTGVEGGAIYAFSSEIATAVETAGKARFEVDLRRDLDLATLQTRLSSPRGKQSVSNWLRKVVQLPPVSIALLREVFGAVLPAAPRDLAVAIKQLPLETTGFSGLERAISTAGGIRLDEVDENLMLRRKPGVFVAGEMLDWSAPTGGYLLQGVLATGRAAGVGCVRHLCAFKGEGMSAEPAV